MSEPDQYDIAGRLRRLVETHDIAEALSEPLEASIMDLLERSAAQIGSGEASVLVREPGGGGLRFLAATGKVADQLAGMTIPPGKGIAGFVLMSGQPMAVSDAGGDETFYAEVDRATGFSTQSILALPLRFADEIIGVLEYVNRKGDPPFAPFTPDEMDTAGVYADAIAALVNALEGKRILASFARRSLNEVELSDVRAAAAWIEEIRGSETHRDRVELALLIRELASRGDAERLLAKEIIGSILRFSRGSDERTFLA